eukprot:PhM_4_TR17390/c0_g1_i7/m.92731
MELKSGITVASVHMSKYESASAPVLFVMFMGRPSNQAPRYGCAKGARPSSVSLRNHVRGSSASSFGARRPDATRTSCVPPNLSSTNSTSLRSATMGSTTGLNFSSVKSTLRIAKVSVVTPCDFLLAIAQRSDSKRRCTPTILLWQRKGVPRADIPKRASMAQRVDNTFCMSYARPGVGRRMRNRSSFLNSISMFSVSCVGHTSPIGITLRPSARRHVFCTIDTDEKSSRIGIVYGKALYPRRHDVAFLTAAVTLYVTGPGTKCTRTPYTASKPETMAGRSNSSPNCAFCNAIGNSTPDRLQCTAMTTQSTSVCQMFVKPM